MARRQRRGCSEHSPCLLPPSTSVSRATDRSGTFVSSQGRPSMTHHSRRRRRVRPSRRARELASPAITSGVEDLDTEWSAEIDLPDLLGEVSGDHIYVPTYLSVAHSPSHPSLLCIPQLDAVSGQALQLMGSETAVLAPDEHVDAVRRYQLCEPDAERISQARIRLAGRQCTVRSTQLLPDHR